MDLSELIIIITVVFFMITICVLIFVKKANNTKNESYVKNNHDSFNTTVDLNKNDFFDINGTDIHNISNYNSTLELAINKFEIVEDITYCESDIVIEI